MTRIAKYVSDPEIKKLLLAKDKDKKGENGSIGTSATRSAIIDSLIEKHYLREEGKKLISTELGRELYRILPDEIKKANMTAKWWAIQEDIRSGEKTYKSLTDTVLNTIKEIIQGTYPQIDQAILSQRKSSQINNIIGKCPFCGGNIIESKKAFGCSNWKEPISCKFTLWKRGRGVFSKANITAARAKKLLAGKTIRIKNLISNNGTTFTADIVLQVNKDSQYPVQLAFAQSLKKSKNIGDDQTKTDNPS